MKYFVPAVCILRQFDVAKTVTTSRINLDIFIIIIEINFKKVTSRLSLDFYGENIFDDFIILWSIYVLNNEHRYTDTIEENIICL